MVLAALALPVVRLRIVMAAQEHRLHRIVANHHRFHCHRHQSHHHVWHVWKHKWIANVWPKIQWAATPTTLYATLYWKHHRRVINGRNAATKPDELHQCHHQTTIWIVVCWQMICSFYANLFNLYFDSAASDLYKISSSYRVHQMNAQTHRHHYQSTDHIGGDIMTRVAIPRSGSFLNTSGLARYKSRATRRPKCGGGGGG